MLRTLYEIPFRELKGILLNFNETAKLQDSPWIKLPYPVWRDVIKWLNRMIDENEIAVIQEEECNSSIWIAKKGYTDKDYVLSLGTGEYSLAEFLLQYLKENYLEMSATNYTTVTGNGATSNTISYNNNYSTTASPSYIYTTGTNWQPTISPAVEINKDGVFIEGKRVLTEEDKENMDKNVLNLELEFGPMDSPLCALTPFGIAVRTIDKDKTYCYYDPVACQIVDCTPFAFDTRKFIYKVPVAVSDIAEGDIIMHYNLPMFVKGIEDNEGRIVVIDVAQGEEKYILPKRNMFGFNYVTKVISLFDMKNNGASVENPFGNMLPMLMLMNDSGKDLDPLMLLMMNGGQIGGMDMDVFTKNPLMMYMMMKDNKNLKDMLPFLMMTSAMPVQK